MNIIKYVIFNCIPLKIKWPNHADIVGLVHKHCTINKRSVGAKITGVMSKELRGAKECPNIKDC